MTISKEMLAELEQACVTRNPLLADRLRPGLPAAKIRSKLRRAGASGEIEVLVELYAWHDGTELDHEYALSKRGLFPGVPYHFPQFEQTAADFRHFFPAAAVTQPVLSEAIGRYFPVLWDGSVAWFAIDIAPGQNNRVVFIELGSTPGIWEAYSSPVELIEDMISANRENRTLRCFSREKAPAAKRQEGIVPPPAAAKTREIVEPRLGGTYSFASEGGPHIVLPNLALGAWKGSSKDCDFLDPSTDYGRACLVKEPVGLLSVGDQQALILAGSPPMSGWRKKSRSTIDLLVFEGWSEEGPEALAETIVPTLGDSDFIDTGLRWTIRGDGATLMSAADEHGNAYGFGEVQIPLRSGTYKILQARSEGREGTFWIFRLAPVARKSTTRGERVE